MSAEKRIRYRARIRCLDPDVLLTTLHATRDRAIKEAVDTILENGTIEIQEVPVRRRTRIEYEEIE